jgi:ABC-type multidrug transport system fused ATPase/permease subunit
MSSENPFEILESDIRKLELQIIQETDPVKKVELEQLLRKFKKELDDKKHDADYTKRQQDLQRETRRQTSDSGNIAFFIIGLLFPYPIGVILWIVLLLMGKKNNAGKTAWGIITSTLLLILFIICYVTFGWTMFNQYTDTLNKQMYQTTETVSSILETEASTNTSVETVSDDVDTTKLEEDQVIAWVKAVDEYLKQESSDLTYNTYIDDDNLLYISVNLANDTNVGDGPGRIYRINADGILQVQFWLSGNRLWYTASRKYLDTSIVKQSNGIKDEAQLNPEDAEIWIKVIADEYKKVTNYDKSYTIRDFSDIGSYRDSSYKYYNVQFAAPGDVFMILRIKNNVMEFEKNTLNADGNYEYVVISKYYLDTNTAAQCFKSTHNMQLTDSEITSWVTAVENKIQEIRNGKIQKYNVLIKDGHILVFYDGDNESFRTYKLLNGILQVNLNNDIPSKFVDISYSYLDTSYVNNVVKNNLSSDQVKAADFVRDLMIKNQGFDSDIIASIPDEEILAANAGNATNSAIAQTAKNLLDKYPNLKK